MERRFITTEIEPVELVTREDGGLTATGYAAVFYRQGNKGTQFDLWSGSVERIMPTAFDRAVAEGDDVRALFNHDPNQLLGRSPDTLRLSVDKRGLKYEIDLPDTSTGRDVGVSLARGDLSGSSFAFQVEEETWRQEKKDLEVREVKSVRLFDVGPVTFPAYKATTSGVRGEELSEVRARRDTWHEAQKASRVVASDEDLKRFEKGYQAGGLVK